MKALKYILIGLMGLLFAACEQMDYNYEQYLEEEVVYSPSVRNLEAESFLKEVTLRWDNPPSNIAKNIIIDYQDSVITTETMIDSVHLVNLAVKGYTILVYTKDAFGNVSIPASVTAFPNGEDKK